MALRGRYIVRVLTGNYKSEDLNQSAAVCLDDGSHRWLSSGGPRRAWFSLHQAEPPVCPSGRAAGGVTGRGVTGGRRCWHSAFPPSSGEPSVNPALSSRPVPRGCSGAAQPIEQSLARSGRSLCALCKQQSVSPELFWRRHLEASWDHICSMQGSEDLQSFTGGCVRVTEAESPVPCGSL